MHVLIISLLCEALRSSRVIFHNKCYNNSITAMNEENTPDMTPEHLPFDPLPESPISQSKSLLELDTPPKEQSPQKAEVVTRLSGIEKDSPEKQRRRVRELLDEVEKKTEFFNSDGVQERELINSREKLDNEVWKEVVARLHLHATTVGLNWVFLSEKDVSTEDKLRTIVGKLTTLEESGQKRTWLIDGHDLEVLFKRDLEGLGIAKAYNLLQEKSYYGIRDKNGEIVDRPKKTEAQVQSEEKEILGKLGGDTKSLELARRLRFVLFEQSAEGWKITDPVSQTFFFEETRKILDAGPSFTHGKIFGLGAPFLRWTTVNGERLFNNDKYMSALDDIDHAKNFAEQNRAIMRLGRLNRLEPSKMQLPEEYILPIEGSNVNYTDIPEGDYAKYLAGYLRGMLTVKKLLLQTDWKPEDMFGDKIDAWNAPFRNSDDKEQRLGHRVLFIAGALHSAFDDRNRASNLQWDQQKWRTVRRLLTEPRAAANNMPFLTKEQMDYIENKLNLHPARRLFGVKPEKF